MKKFHTLLAGLALCVCMLAACSSCKDDDNKETNYLTSVDTAKSGIVGTWKFTSGGSGYHSYNAAGIMCSGTSETLLNNCDPYEVLKVGSNYVLHVYDNTVSAYSDYTITVLNETSLHFVYPPESVDVKMTRVR